MLTFQDFEHEGRGLIPRVISEHRASELYQTAMIADEYDRQRNTTICNYVQTLFSLTGSRVVDFTATNSRIASNFFNRLNTQRCAYSLGNGVAFADDEEGRVKAALGPAFDKQLSDCAYNALIHGLTFGFWDVDRLYNFPVTEFAPLWDENTGRLRAGVRFWRLGPDKPVTATLYEEDGYTTLTGKDYGALEVAEEKRGYRQLIRMNQADGARVVGYENYGSLPVVPFWGSRLHQSTLVGLREAIDSYDLIRSGFANDLSDCAQVYWLLENYGGMDDTQLKRFRDRLKFQHIAVADTNDGGKVTPYTQEIPYEAREAYLKHIREGIYEDFGALDVHTISAASTNDHIDAAYQPMDEQADLFEYQCAEFIQQICRLNGIEDAQPLFKRTRISNQTEQTEMVLSAAQYLDTRTILKLLPFVTVDQIDTILENLDREEGRRLSDGEQA